MAGDDHDRGAYAVGDRVPAVRAADGSQQTGAVETVPADSMFDFGPGCGAVRAVVGTDAARQHRSARSARATTRWRRPASTTAEKSIFIKLTDLDQNLDANVAETVITTIRSANGDQ